MCRSCWFAVVLARGDKDNIGASWRQTLAIFADCSAQERQNPLLPSNQILFCGLRARFARCSFAVALEPLRKALVMESRQTPQVLASLAGLACVFLQ